MNEEDRANELYWNSRRSVNSIADELGLSKGRLYGAVRPLPSGSTCPSCGAELVFENRTARDRNAASCNECGREAEVSAEPPTGRGSTAPDDTGSIPIESSTLARILIGAAIGGAVGVLLVRRFRD